MKKFGLFIFCLLASVTLFAQDDEAKIKRLIDDLASDSLEVRENATDELIEMGEKAKKFIEEALKETNDPEVKSRCEIILKTFHVRLLVGEEVYKKMPDKIRDFAISRDLLERLKILKEIKDDEKISDDKLKPVVDIIVEDVSEREERGLEIIEFIGKNNLRSASKILVKLLEDQVADVRGRAAEVLVYLGAKEYAKDIARLLEDQEAGVRQGAAWALAQLQAKEYAKDIARLLEDQNAGVRWRAARSLAELGVKEYAKDIAKLLEDQDAWARHEAALALGQLGAKEYANDIAKLLEDQDAWVRSDAAWALGLLEAKEYAKDITRLLEDNDKVVQINAKVVLIKFGEDKYLKDVVKLLEDGEGEVRYQVARALGLLEIKESLDLLKKRLEKEESDTVRKAIEEAIKKIESQKEE